MHRSAVVDGVDGVGALEVAAFDDDVAGAGAVELSCRFGEVLDGMQGHTDQQGRFVDVGRDDEGVGEELEQVGDLGAVIASWAPVEAAMTGSTTRLGSWPVAASAATASTLAVLGSTPVLVALMSRSARTASIWAWRNSVGGMCTACTPVVFCAVSTVTALVP